MDEFGFRPLDEGELAAMSSLALAHIGDGVFELFVRTGLCAAGDTTAQRLHRDTVARVSAPAQARAFRRIEPLLTEEERGVYRRGRNAKVSAIPKNASISEYHMATGLEALFGWLYLKNQTPRLRELFGVIAEGY